jgi:hypothetical protein
LQATVTVHLCTTDSWVADLQQFVNNFYSQGWRVVHTTPMIGLGGSTGLDGGYSVTNRVLVFWEREEPADLDQ